MPDGSAPNIELTREQIEFLSKYLHVPESQLKGFFKGKGTKRAAAARIKEIKTNYKAYETAKADMDALFKKIETETDLSLVPEVAKEIIRIRDRVMVIADKVWGAAAEEPQFGWGATELNRLMPALQRFGEKAAQMAATVKLPPPPIPPRKTDLFDTLKAQVQGFEAFEDQAGLTWLMAKTPIEDDPEPEAKRATAFAAHETLCKAAYSKIGGLRGQVSIATPQDEVWDVERLAVIARDALFTDRRAEIDAIVAALNAHAKKGMETRAIAGNEIAKTEIARDTRIASEEAKLKKATDALQAKVGKLERDRDAATGFQQKRDLDAEYKAEKERLDAMRQKMLQLEAYQQSASARLEKMKEATDAQFKEEQLAKVFTAAESPEAGFQKWLEKEEKDDGVMVKPKKEPLSGEKLAEAIAELTSGLSEDVLASQINALKPIYTASAQNIVISAKMYLNEPDITEITTAQCATLHKILDNALSLLPGGHYGEAKVLADSTGELWNKFKDARIFQLPKVAETGETARDALQRRIDQAGVSLDRLWGLGGDADGALRTKLDALGPALIEAMKVPPVDLRDVEKSLAALEVEIGNAASTIKPLDGKELSARKEAKETEAAITKKLLGLYQTKEISEGDVSTVDSDHLLSITLDGTVKFYEIETGKDGRVDKFDKAAKSIPPEAVERLRAQMEMLAALNESNAAGMADAIRQAAQDAEDLLKAIVAGAGDYERVTTALNAFEKTYQKKSNFIEWRPTGVDDLRLRKDKFTTTYAGSMTPSDAAVKAEALQEEAAQLEIASGKLEAEYKRVKTLLENVETSMAAKQKGQDGTLGQVLTDLIKAKKVAPVDTSAMGVMEQAEAEKMQQDIAQSIDYLIQMGHHGTGVQGEFRDRLRDLNRTLDTKSDFGIKEAEKGAKALETELAAEAAKVLIKPSDDPTEYLKNILALVKGNVTAAAKVEKLKFDATEAENAAAAALTKVKDALDKNEKTLSNHTEYKTVYDAMMKELSNAKQSYDKNKDAEYAATQFSVLQRQAEDLASDIGDLTTSSVPVVGYDYAGKQDGLVKNITKVGGGAVTAAKTMMERASEDQKAKHKVALGKVEKALSLANTAALQKVPEFSAKLATDLEAALKLEGDSRKAALSKLREQSLSELRRMQVRLQNDPALVVYRDNPFDHGAAWPQFAATLHNAEVDMLRGLKP
jgi:hypothetical protein